jgi:hypothetical protein
MSNTWTQRAQRALSALVASASLLGCQLPGAPTGSGAGTRVAAPGFALGAVQLADALAKKPGVNWQDAMVKFPALQAARQQQARHRQLQAVTAPGWSFALGANPSSNVPCFVRAALDYGGPNPAAGDLLYVLANNGKILKFNPTSATAPSQAAPTISTGNVPGTYTKTAIAISGDNQRLYTFSTGGDFSVVDATTLTTTYTKDISSSGFANCAFFLDYGNPLSGGTTNFGSIEALYAVSSNGSVFRIVVDGSGGGTPSVTVNVAAAPNESNPGGGAWTTSTALGIPTTTVNTFPVAWKDHVYYGTTGGMFYEVSFDNPSAPTLARSWNLALNTTASLNGRAITAPAALDMDGNNDVDKAFVPCGDRLNWIDMTDGSVTTSPSLTLDRSKALTTPAAAAPAQFGPLSAFTPASTTQTQYNPDWVSISRSALPPPTRWGGPLASLASIPALSVRTRPNGDVWVCDFGKTTAPTRAPNVTIYHANGSPTKVIPLSGPPTKLEFDGQGFCWLSVSGYSTNGAQGAVEKINVATETRVTTGFPVTFNGAVYIAPDANGNCWVTDPFNRPGTGNPNAIGGGGTAGRLQCIHSNGTFAFANPVAVPVAGTIFCDPNNRPWVMPYGSNVIMRYPVCPNGTGNGAPTANTLAVGGGGSLPIGIAFRPSTTEAWVTLNSQSKIARVDYNTFTLIGGLLPASGSGPSNPWTIRFDATGDPWVGCGRLGQTSPSSVAKLDFNGNLVPGETYDMSSSGGSPYELAFDAADTVYVANANPSFSAGSLNVITQSLGNTGDIFATSYRGAPGDNNDSFGFMRFKWANNAFNNLPVADARLTLTQNNSTSGDNLTFYTADNVRADGTLWNGYLGGATPNTDWDTRPNVRVPFFSLANGAPGAGQVLTVQVPPPADKANVAGDAANAHYTLAVQSTNRALKAAVHWFSDNTNSSAAQLPTLTIKTNSYAQLSTAQGIACQPTIDITTQHVYLAASNALFDLDYSSKGKFATPANVYYNFTTAGGSAGYGPVNTGTTPKTFLNATGNALLTLNGRVVIPDVTPTGALSLSNFNTNLARTGNRLVTSTDITPGTGGVNTQMLFDYDGGSAYVVTTNNYVIRAKVM